MVQRILSGKTSQSKRGETMTDTYDNPYIMGYFRDRPIKPQKIVWGYPDTLEMTDKDGNVHTYSIIEILDGLVAVARQQKDAK